MIYAKINLNFIRKVSKTVLVKPQNRFGNNLRFGLEFPRTYQKNSYRRRKGFVVPTLLNGTFFVTLRFNSADISNKIKRNSVT